MANKNVVVTVDDLDGSTDGVTRVRFGLDDRTYAIDLSAPNRQKLVDSLEIFVAAATPTPECEPSSGRSVRHRERTRAIRAWAQENGYQLADRGRVPSAVIDAFDAAHP